MNVISQEGELLRAKLFAQKLAFICIYYTQNLLACVCDIFVDSGMAVDAKRAIHALSCDVTFEHHGEPRVQTNVRVGINAAQSQSGFGPRTQA